MSLPNLLRLPLKVILFPIRITLSIFTGITGFILRSTIVNKIFALVSGIFFLGFLALTWSAIFVQQDMSLLVRILMPCLALLASYVFNPMSGALKYMRLLVERIEDLNSYIKKI